VTTERDLLVERAIAEIVEEAALEKRFIDRLAATERRIIDILNERFDAVMAALDRKNDP
jgi:hypothetical protein